MTDITENHVSNVGSSSGGGCTVSVRVMRGELQNTSISSTIYPTNMSPTEDALAEIESLGSMDSICYTNMAKRNGFWRSTLTRRHQAATLSNASKSINERKLDEQQEQELVRYIARLTRQGLPSTRALIQNFASDVAKSPVSESWVIRFIGRHSIHLISKWTAGMDINRHQADSGAKYSLYFNLLGDKITHYGIEPHHTYNMNEKGFLIGITGRSKRIFNRRMWERREVRAAIQDGSREWITVLACVCAGGSHLPPSLIYQSATNAM
jgi:hypothetical protein